MSSRFQTAPCRRKPVAGSQTQQFPGTAASSPGDSRCFCQPPFSQPLDRMPAGSAEPRAPRIPRLRCSHAAHDRQLRFLHLQPGAVSGRAGRGRCAWRATTRSRSTRSPRSGPSASACRPAPARRPRPASRCRSSSASRARCPSWRVPGPPVPSARPTAATSCGRSRSCTARRRASRTVAPTSSPACPRRTRPYRYNLAHHRPGHPARLPGSDGHRGRRRHHGRAHKTLPLYGVQFHRNRC